MNVPPSQSLARIASDSGDGEIDPLLEAYFRAELPRHWPVPSPTPTMSVPRHSPLTRSRLALAAAVVLLLGGGLWLGELPSASESGQPEITAAPLEATHRPFNPTGRATGKSSQKPVDSTHSRP